MLNFKKLKKWFNFWIIKMNVSLLISTLILWLISTLSVFQFHDKKAYFWSVQLRQVIKYITIKRMISITQK